MTDMINHPPHYKAGGIEVIDVIEAYGLGYHLGNVIKYVLRAGRKGYGDDDLRKARWYLDRRIEGVNAKPCAPEKFIERKARTPLYYLATPYTKYHGGDIELAFRHAATLAARLLKIGLKVYSPIAHTHPVAKHGDIDPLDLSIWLPFDEAMMQACDELIVARMDGWNESIGVRHEINYFARAGKPVTYLDPATLKPFSAPHLAHNKSASEHGGSST